MARTHTPNVVHPDGTRTITTQRYCNGCNQPIGDATDDEIDAALWGHNLPDVRSECPTCTPAVQGA